GYNDMAEIFTKLNALFQQTHPATQFNLQLKGTATAAPALTLGTSDLAPMGAEFSAMELETYQSFVGADPQPVRVAHCSLNARALSAPVGIYVNDANPIQNLTTEQVARIFTAGNSQGDITNWGQVGMKGDWAQRPIHPCGIAEEAAAGLASFMLKKMSARPFARDYDSFAQSRQVVQRVREDPSAIGFASGNIGLPGTKLVGIGGTALTESNVVSGKYPYDRHLLIYIRNVPGQPVDALVKEYLHLALSQDGQKAIASASPYYLPLNDREAAAELAKLDLPPVVRSKTPEKVNTKIALYRLITGMSSYGLIPREIWPLESRPFRQTYGYDPAAIRIAHSASRGVYLNAKNPLSNLAMEQVARIFTTGGAGGDITQWAQLGWADRAIHLYGPRDDGSFATALRHSKMGGLPFARGYEAIPTTAGCMQAVADDPYGIAIIDAYNANLLLPGVKFLPLADLSSHLTLYVNRAPGKSLDPAAEAYARRLLSGDGQATLAGDGYLPLTDQEVAAELKKL
ncbi:MAG: substrate-binding domain-containing protein, partial [Acidobacteriota bacterium]|nr:substrate-binding domain-containing protein [Acidobacteriota bacterium]